MVVGIDSYDLFSAILVQNLIVFDLKLLYMQTMVLFFPLITLGWYFKWEYPVYSAFLVGIILDVLLSNHS
jgi:glucose-6-phosphate-specific signal transduction histidine kinase